ncbi:SulP family inorganic anion transporter [Streptomyces capparidis]
MDSGPARSGKPLPEPPTTDPTPGPPPGPPAAPRATARERRRADLSASVVVFLIAIPLSLGIALATGAPLQAGLIAAAVGGIVVGALGGAPLQVSGPAAGLVVVTADLIQQYGWRTTCAITVMSGLAQLLLGSLRVARAALAVSPSIVHGMLAGIGLTVALAQLHVVLGGGPESSVVANLEALPGQLVGHHPTAVGVGLLTLAVLVVWPRLPGRAGEGLRKVPAPLAAVVTATAVASGCGLDLDRVELPSWNSHALPGLPDGPVLGIAAAVLTVTLVASVESLLSAVAVDRLAAARPGGGPRSDLDRELLGQGAGNVVSGALGGLPVTGVAVRSSANVRAGAATRASGVMHGCWVLLCVGLLAGLLERIPLAALAALVMMVGLQMVSLLHIRNVRRHREFPVYLATVVGVLLGGVLEGVAVGIAVAVVLALRRLAHTRVQVAEVDGGYRVDVGGQLTFLAVPKLSRALAQVPDGARAVLELGASSMDHAASETVQAWRAGHEARGGTVAVHGEPGRYTREPAPFEPSGPPGSPGGTGSAGRDEREQDGLTKRDGSRRDEREQDGSAGRDEREPAAPGGSAWGGAPPVGAAGRRPWTPWGGTGLDGSRAAAGPAACGGVRLVGGVSTFQRETAPLVRTELARLAREGQRPSHLFLTCADSRLVTSMITSSGPGDLFTVRNMGNLVPPPHEEDGDASVAAAIEYAVEVLRVGTVTVCGHSGCGAIQTLLRGGRDGDADTSMARWLRHGRPSLERLGDAAPRLGDRPAADDVERLALANVVRQLENLRAHPCVAEREKAGDLHVTGMYFDFTAAQAYLLDPVSGAFEPVRPDAEVCGCAP